MEKEGRVIKPKKKLMALSINEELGDVATHFMKSGSSFRPKKDLEVLNKFKHRLIPDSYRELPFEYDVMFNTNEVKTIRAWLYTDFLGKGIYVKVNSVKINDKLFKDIVNSDIKIDEERIEKIIANLQNKYSLQWNTEFHEKVIFPPGSNLMRGPLINFNKVKKLVKEHVDWQTSMTDSFYSEFQPAYRPSTMSPEKDNFEGISAVEERKT